MSKEPGRRYRSAGDLGRAAAAAAEGRRERLTETPVATGAAALVASASVPHPPRRTPGGRSAVAVGGAAAVLLVVLALAAALALGAFGSDPSTSAEEPIPLEQSPDRLTIFGGKVWALETNGGRLARIDPATRRAEYFPTPIDLGGGSFPAIASGAGSIWISHANPTVGGIDRVDPVTVQGIEHIALDSAQGVTVGKDAVWATTAPVGKNGALVRIAPRTNAITDSRPRIARRPVDVAEGSDAVWVADAATDTVVRVDPRSLAVVARVAVGDGPARLAIASTGVWVANLGDRTLTLIDPATNHATGAPVSLGKEIQDIAVAAGRLWVASADDTVTPLELDTGEVAGPSITVGRAPHTLAAAGDELWVANIADQSIQRVPTGR